ncbi:hypothetical protein [Crateriforma conspicua]|nr:hypothetical protein [Crateriforma conspicua]
MRALFNWPQFLVPLKCGDEFDEDAEHTTAQATVSSRLPSKGPKSGREAEFEELCSRLFERLPRVDIQEFKRFVASIDSSVNSSQRWTQVFAYTDFASLPMHALILALAATVEEKQLPSRRVFAERCRLSLRSRGIADAVLRHRSNHSQGRSEADEYIRAAHMVACLEQPVATEGYLDAAVQFEKMDDVRSALACVYRNARHRLRAGKLAELDADIKTFDVGSAGVDTMLAVLTATAPAKSKLPSRKRLFRRIKAELKSRGELDKGLLDGLN